MQFLMYLLIEKYELYWGLANRSWGAEIKRALEVCKTPAQP